MDATMDNLPTPTPDNGGWYLAAALAIAGIFKAIVQRVQRRDVLQSKMGSDAQEHTQRIELKALAAEETATSRLVKTLQDRVGTLEKIVEDLSKWKFDTLQARALDLQENTLLKADLSRVRRQRDRATRISKRAVDLARRAEGSSAAEAGRLHEEIEELGAEMSEADDARSLPGVKL